MKKSINYICYYSVYDIYLCIEDETFKFVRNFHIEQKNQ